MIKLKYYRSNNRSLSNNNLYDDINFKLCTTISTVVFCSLRNRYKRTTLKKITD